MGRGILGVIDGFNSKGIETEKDIADRMSILRKNGVQTLIMTRSIFDFRN